MKNSKNDIKKLIRTIDNAFDNELLCDSSYDDEIWDYYNFKNDIMETIYKNYGNGKIEDEYIYIFNGFKTPINCVDVRLIANIKNIDISKEVDNIINNYKNNKDDAIKIAIDIMNKLNIVPVDDDPFDEIKSITYELVNKNNSIFLVAQYHSEFKGDKFDLDCNIFRIKL